MRLGDMIVRWNDCAPFIVTDVGHWSIIVNDDTNPNETYRVKWYGECEQGSLYVSDNGVKFCLWTDLKACNRLTVTLARGD